MNLKSIILEVLDTELSDYKINVGQYSKNISVDFSVDSEKYELNFSRDVYINELVTIDFKRYAGEEGWNMSSPEGNEHNPAKILGSILNLIKTVLIKFPDIKFLTFNTDKSNTSRIRLYNSIVKRSIEKGIVKYADKNSEMYKEIILNHPDSWVLEVI
jgi:hypothetical protein